MKISLCGLHFHFHARHPDRPIDGPMARTMEGTPLFRCKLLLFLFQEQRVFFRGTTRTGTLPRCGMCGGLNFFFCEIPIFSSLWSHSLLHIRRQDNRRRFMDPLLPACSRDDELNSSFAHAFRSILLLLLAAPPTDTTIQLSALLCFLCCDDCELIARTHTRLQARDSAVTTHVHSDTHGEKSVTF